MAEEKQQKDQDQVMDMSAFGEDFEILDENPFELPDSTDDGKDDGKDKDKKDKKDDNSASGTDDNPSDSEKKESVASKKDTDGEDDSDSDDGDDSSQKLYSSLASALAEEGIISSPEDPIKGPEDLFNTIKKEIQRNEFSDLTDTQKEYLEAVRNGVSVEEFKTVKSFEQQLDNITDEQLAEDVELRKSIITQNYMNQGLSEEKANKLAQQAVDLNTDVEEAKEGLESVKQFTKEAYQKRIDAQKAAKQKIIDDQIKQAKELKKAVFDTKEIIPGMPINEKVKNDIHDQMTKVIGKSKDGKPLNAFMKAREEDPINFTIKMHYLFHLTNGFKNFDKVVTKSKSDAVKQLDNLIKGNTFVKSGDEAQKNLDYDIDDNFKTVLNNLDL